MTVDEEQKIILNADKKIRESIDIIYQNIDNVENNILDLLRVAPAVFDEETFNKLLNHFQLFDNQSGNFENIVSQITEPVMTIAEAITVDVMMRKLSKTMDELVEFIKKCNAMVEAHNFSISKSLLLEKLDNNYSYDTVHYKDLDEAVNHPFLVVLTSDVLDEGYPQQYYPLHVLGIRSFDNKVDAMKYCLANKISRDNLILRY